MEANFTEAWLAVNVPLHQLQKLADRACRRWRVSTVPVRFKKQFGRYYAFYFEGERIELYKKGRNVPVLLHETAHHIESELFDGDAHGPTFLAVEMDLLDHYGVLPRACFRQLAKKHGVKIARL